MQERTGKSLLVQWTVSTITSYNEEPLSSDIVMWSGLKHCQSDRRLKCSKPEILNQCKHTTFRHTSQTWPTVEDQHHFRSNIDRVNGLEHQKLKGTAMLWWFISHCEHIHLLSAHICHLLHWYTLTHSTTYCTGTQCNILCIVNNTWQVIVKVSQPKHQVYHWSLICIVFVASKSSKEHSTVVTQVSLLTLYYLCRAYPNTLRKLRNCWCNKVFVLQSASYNQPIRSIVNKCLSGIVCAFAHVTSYIRCRQIVPPSPHKANKRLQY